jgi:inorganic phosphate transporter, PiT family
LSNGTAATLDTRFTPRTGRVGLVVFGTALALGVIYVASQLSADLATVRSPSVFPYLLLGVALFVALAFEFVNGFHDTANAVATVIYTNSLEPHAAVVWSGIWNFIGVLLSSGVVAFGIISLLPVELILQVGSAAGFAMVYALLFAAIIWNLGTWYFGLPSSSSHTLIGSIIGVGLANQLGSSGSATSGVDWEQALSVGKSLLISPIVGFMVAALLLTVARVLIPRRELYEPPAGDAPPPLWIRAILILTCTGVSFGHGSNDGQKGMGLIMLILIGTVPTAYALNYTVSPAQLQNFVVVSRQTVDVIEKYAPDEGVGDPRDVITKYVRTRELTPATMTALGRIVNDITNELVNYGELKHVPPDRVRNFRNDLYVVSEALRLIQKSGAVAFSAQDSEVLRTYTQHVNAATKFIPDWVKVAVAIALGLGTTIGWKRIVRTVGEKIGRDHLTYAQGAAAEITAMATIAGADAFGLPVSTTHVLSSGVAGTMAANHSGLQWGTVRNLLTAWALTLPASIGLSAVLFWTFRSLTR